MWIRKIGGRLKLFTFGELHSLGGQVRKEVVYIASLNTIPDHLAHGRNDMYICLSGSPLNELLKDDTQ